MTRPHPSRKLLMTLLLLVAGAIVNVAVAWGLCFTSSLHPTRNLDHAEAASIWQLHRRATWPSDLSAGPHGLASEARGIGLTDRRVSWVGDGADMFVVGQHEAGLPMRTLTGAYFDDLGSAVGWDNAVEAPDAAMGYLPIRLLWPGFAINTVFYALVLWLLFAAPLALRHRRRIRGGLCPKCAYDLRGTDSAMCPECGSAM